MGHRAGVGADRGERRPGRASWPKSSHAARRFLLSELPGSEAIEAASLDPEHFFRSDEPPVLASPSLLEPDGLRAIRVGADGDRAIASGFGGFLDGTQNVRNEVHCAGMPVVWATVSAAVRIRVERRLTSWPAMPPRVEQRIYLPLGFIAGVNPDFAGLPGVVDTSGPDSSGVVPSRHPAALLERAMRKVQQDRERLEQSLAEEWCAREGLCLYIDGSISASAAVSSSPVAVGVIKSHRVLYADGPAFAVLMSLQAGERTAAFLVDARGRNPVASWYLRLRSARGRDPLFGLIRIEVAMSPQITQRADEISRWVLAEGAPLALPDGRWDKLAYGIRHTEEFLRAIS